MTTKEYDRKRGTWIYDNGDFRAIVYKVSGEWVLRAGPRRSGLIAPETEVYRHFKQRRRADYEAFRYLDGEVTS